MRLGPLHGRNQSSNSNSICWMRGIVSASWGFPERNRSSNSNRGRGSEFEFELEFVGCGAHLRRVRERNRSSNSNSNLLAAELISGASASEIGVRIRTSFGPSAGWCAAMRLDGRSANEIGVRIRTRICRLRRSSSQALPRAKSEFEFELDSLDCGSPKSGDSARVCSGHGHGRARAWAGTGMGGRAQGHGRVRQGMDGHGHGGPDYARVGLCPTLTERSARRHSAGTVAR